MTTSMDTTAALGSPERPLRVAIIGSGPSGFYAAAPLQKSDIVCNIDMYDRLPTPFGLVRGGVAPDHPKIRNVTKVYEKTAQEAGFHFFGNVTVGQDISIEEMQQYYDAIIFACGAETDRRLGILGEDLPGSYTATSFVGWYNGHPDYRQLPFDLSGEVAVVIGVGNVAMDVARVLAKTVDELKHTDIAQHALDALAESNIREIHIVGRRGAAQAAFTSAELKEMGELADCDPVVKPEDLALNPVSEQELSDKSKQRNYEILQEYAKRTPNPDKRRRMFFHFLEGPVEIHGKDKVESLLMVKNALSGDEPFKQRATATSETYEFPCDVIFRSIGYRGIAIPGVPFDENMGLIPNQEGRVLDNGTVVPGMYAAGWIKRGPSGIIGTNKPDSLETVTKLLEDLPTLTPCPKPDSSAVLQLLRSRGVRVVDIEDWKKIDAAEVERGQLHGKPRERFTAIEEMLAVLDQ